MYYLRSKAAVDPIKFTLDSKYQKQYVGDKTSNSEVYNVDQAKEVLAETEGQVCNMDDPDCLMCGS